MNILELVRPALPPEKGADAGTATVAPEGDPGNTADDGSASGPGFAEAVTAQTKEASGAEPGPAQPETASETNENSLGDGLVRTSLATGDAGLPVVNGALAGPRTALVEGSARVMADGLSAPSGAASTSEGTETVRTARPTNSGQHEVLLQAQARTAQPAAVPTIASETGQGSLANSTAAQGDVPTDTSTAERVLEPTTATARSANADIDPQASVPGSPNPAAGSATDAGPVRQGVPGPTSLPAQDARHLESSRGGYADPRVTGLLQAGDPTRPQSASPEAVKTAPAQVAEKNPQNTLPVQAPNADSTRATSRRAEHTPDAVAQDEGADLPNRSEPWTTPRPQIDASQKLSASEVRQTPSAYQVQSTSTASAFMASAPTQPFAAGNSPLPGMTDSLPIGTQSQTQQVLSQVVSAASVRHDGGTVDLLLDPPELGRIEILMELSETGVRATLTAERQATADLIRRHMDLLAAQFEDAGFSLGDLSYSEGGGNTDGESEDAQSAMSALQNTAPADTRAGATPQSAQVVDRERVDIRL